MGETNIAFYERREAQERMQAARATDDLSRRVHLDLAGRYAALLRASVQAA